MYRTILLATLIAAPALAQTPATYVLPASIPTHAVPCPTAPIVYPAGSTFDARQVDAAHGAYVEHVNVDLAHGVVDTGTCSIAISGFENVEGSPNGGSLIGDDQANVLHGHAPGTNGQADYIVGGGGDDTLTADGRSAILIGGDGTDACTLTGYDKRAKKGKVYVTQHVASGTAIGCETVVRR